MSEPLVSVCMITYNHRPYIAEAIESVLRQETDSPFELVIGEDCSTDGTREIVLDYHKKRSDVIRVISSEQNVGARANGARTIAACRGKYVAFCEGDDYWHHPRKMQTQVEYMEAHPECGIVCSDFDRFFMGTQKKIRSFNRYRRRRPPENATLRDFIENTQNIAAGAVLTCTVMVRRDLLGRISDADPYLHREEAFLMGDTQKWAEIAHLSQLHYIDESLATHNCLVESASNSADWRKTVRFCLSIEEMQLYLCKKYGMPPEVVGPHERQWCGYSFELAFLDGDLSKATEVLASGYRASWREKAKYFAMKNRYLYRLLRHVLLCRRKVGLSPTTGVLPA